MSSTVFVEAFVHLRMAGDIYYLMLGFGLFSLRFNKVLSFILLHFESLGLCAFFFPHVLKEEQITVCFLDFQERISTLCCCVAVRFIISGIQHIW